MSCQAEPSSLEDVFVEAENQLLLYVTYCQNKSRSDAVYREFTGYFEVRFTALWLDVLVNKQLGLDHTMDIIAILSMVFLVTCVSHDLLQDVSSHQQDRLKLPDYLILPVQRITKYRSALLNKSPLK